MIKERLVAVTDKLIEVYPLHLDMAVSVDTDSVTFQGTAYDIEGPYEVHGTVSMDELVEHDTDTIVALVLLRAMIQ